MHQTNHPQHVYRVHLIPSRVEAEDVERMADAGMLRIHQFPAPSSEWAARTARAVSGLAVHSVERIEEVTP